MQDCLIWLWSHLTWLSNVLRSTLWTQEAAGWAQAVFTAVAILFAAWQAGRARRQELEDRTQELRASGRSLALWLLPDIDQWNRKLINFSFYVSGLEKGAIPRDDEKWLDSIRPPQTVMSCLHQLGEYKDIVEPLFAAIYTYRQLRQGCPSSDSDLSLIGDIERELDVNDLIESDIEERSKATSAMRQSVSGAVKRIEALDPTHHAAR